MRKRIVLVTTEARLAGAERVVAELACRLDRARYEVSVVTLKSPQDAGPTIVPQLERAGIELRSCGLDHTWNALGAAHRLQRMFNDTRPDVVHCHLFHANTLGCYVAARCGVPVRIATHHIVERRAMPWRYRVDRWLDARVTCHVAVSRAVAEHQSSHTGIDLDRFRVIYNGTAIASLAELPDRAAARHRWKIDDGVLALGSVGRLDQQKGFIEFLPVFKRLADDNGALHWYIAGAGPLRPRLEAAVEKLGLRGRVHLLGFVGETPLLYRAFDALVVPSRYEGFGLVAIEAMAHRCPVAVARVDSLPEVVEDGADGIVFDMGGAFDPLRRWLALPDRSSYVESAWRKVHSMFSVEAMIDGYDGLYTELLSTGDDPR